MIDRLPPRERQVFEAVHALGSATVVEVQARVPDPKPSNSAVRVMLARLEKKGVLRHEEQDQRYVYSVALPEPKVTQSALRQFVKTFFGGSSLGAAAALIGMAERVSPEELDRIEELIEKARREQRA